MRNRRYLIQLLLITLLVFFVGCAKIVNYAQSDSTTETVMNGKPTVLDEERSVSTPTETSPNESMFEVGIDELADIKVNHKFEITGFIKNNSVFSWEISHGSGMFTYEIFDKEGNAVKQENKILFRNDIGYVTKMKSNDIYRNNGIGQRSKEFYEFVIKKPGKYKVISKAEFQIKNEDKEIQEFITSKAYEFIVK
ncbi:hypothetical protein PASE110613_17880 [Paenibacillus sediminis]|uniref:Proteinase inhibitor I42 chagasin domain-containing protein n=1 Tax=Paenibacillus sediminis TaxID=664909 RepID=A0ABS4H818_9BACL|nr:hypothetical protein [Paenibacillus sediminis]MBP1938669.1 hypothetical protein [Paenibacillus sediminis]